MRDDKNKPYHRKSTMANHFPLLISFMSTIFCIRMPLQPKCLYLVYPIILSEVSA